MRLIRGYIQLKNRTDKAKASWEQEVSQHRSIWPVESLCQMGLNRASLDRDVPILLIVIVKGKKNPPKSKNNNNKKMPGHFLYIINSLELVSQTGTTLFLSEEEKNVRLICLWFYIKHLPVEGLRPKRCICI